MESKIVIRKVSKTKDGNCRINIDSCHLGELRNTVTLLELCDAVGIGNLPNPEDVLSLYDKMWGFCNDIVQKFDKIEKDR